MRFERENGLYDFWQWDFNQQLIVNDPDCTEVHFSNGIYENSPVCEVKDGKVDVPNILLQEATPLEVFCFVNTGGSGYTRYAQVFLIKQRNRPDNYIYTETQVKTFETLEANVYGELEAMRQLIYQIPQFDIKVVSALPEIGKERIVYLLPDENKEGNLYAEYIWIDSKWELLGKATAEVDLTDYVKNTDYAGPKKYGLVAPYSDSNYYGIDISEQGRISVNPANDYAITAKLPGKYPLCAEKIDLIAKTGLTKNNIHLTAEEQAAAQSWLGVEGIKTIQPDENGECMFFIWDHPEGIYRLPYGARISFVGHGTALHQSFPCEWANAVIIIMDEGEFLNIQRKSWFFFAGNSQIKTGRTYDTGGETTTSFSLTHFLSSYKNADMNAVLTFNKQPTMTAELAADDNSTNIPNTAWVNTAIQTAIQQHLNN